MNDTDFQQLIITSLADADPGSLAGLQSTVPVLWQLHARYVLPEQRFWHVKRDAVRHLQACVNHEIDYQRRNINSSRTSFTNSRQDSNSNTVSNEASSSHSDRHMTSVYNDATDSSGTASSIATRTSTQSSHDDMSYTDAGQGSSSANRNSSITATTNIDDTQTDSNAFTVDGYRWVASHKSDDSLQAQAAENLGISLLGVSVAEALTVTTTGRSNTYSNEDHSGETRTTTSSLTIDQNHQAQSTQPSTQTSSSSFTNDITTSATGASSSQMNGSSSSQSQYGMSGTGLGTMTSAGSGSSQMDASGTRAAHADGESHMGLSAGMQNTSLMEKLHQRFINLQKLWEQCTEMILKWENQRMGLSPYVTQAMNTPVCVVPMVTPIWGTGGW